MDNTAKSRRNLLRLGGTAAAVAGFPFGVAL